jgi:hypothetical protein
MPEAAAPTFVHSGRRYTWSGGFGAIFTSRERGVAAGNVRMIAGELFYAYMVQPSLWPWAGEIWWTQPQLTMDHVRELKARLFSVETGWPPLTRPLPPPPPPPPADLDFGQSD